MTDVEWKLPLRSSYGAIFDADNRTVCMPYITRFDDNADNAHMRTIVRAVNNFDQLVSELSRIAEMFAPLIRGGKPDSHWIAGVNGVEITAGDIRRIQALIAKCREA